MTIINAFLFFLIALVYSSAGFGGGSMYLAILSQVSNSESTVRVGGLLCNAVVTTTGTINFQLKKWIAWRPVLLLLLCSVPACIIGSWLPLSSKTYFIILGACLLVSGFITLLRKNTSIENENAVIVNKWWLYPVSFFLGFISGVTGIGGGVYLAPLLHLSSWGSAKHIAAASSLYILINSVAGLSIQIYKGAMIDWTSMIWLIVAVLLGGLIGSRLSSSLLSQKMVRMITGLIIIFAAVKVLIRHL